MRVNWAAPDTLRARNATLGRQGGFVEVVTEEGDLVLRMPVLTVAARRQLRRRGLILRKTSLPRIRRIVAIGTPFQHKVWQACMRIPPGQTRTYGELARAIGCRSARAVGAALGANPLAGIIPCHRVGAADGPGGFAWGIVRKRRWLAAEKSGAAL